MNALMLPTTSNLSTVGTYTGGATAAEARMRARLGWQAKEAPVLYQTARSAGMFGRPEQCPFPGKKVLYRDDNNNPLGVVSSSYRTVQPADILGFYDDLIARHGFTLETVGSMRGGRFIWALAKTGTSDRLMGQDELAAYLLLYTSYDASCATVARFTSYSFACENMLHLIRNERGQPVVSIRHNAIFRPGEVKLQLGLGPMWDGFMANAERLANTPVTVDQSIDYFMQVYYGKKASDVKEGDKGPDKTMERMARYFVEAPGQGMRSRQGTAWGLLNAVTYDIDHNTRARTEENAAYSALVAGGAATKRKAWEQALALAA